MKIDETNFRLIRYWHDSHRRQLKNEFDRNIQTIKDATKRNDDIIKEMHLLDKDYEEIAACELESELKFLNEIERNCKRCGKLYDKRQSNDELCPACFTSNA